ncbi:MAG: hypothetical protein GDA37_10440 [Ekhidna sp.]|nr:hypothetical protein [Ekhidna sp.]
MKYLLRTIFISFFLTSCNTSEGDKTEKSREEIIEKSELEKHIEDSKDLAEDVKKDVETAIEKFKKQKERITKEADNLREATEQELEDVINQAEKEYEDWSDKDKEQL